MLLIREVVKNAFSTGCLTVEAEEKLRHLLTAKYDSKDFKAFMLLQQAVISGAIRQESRELAVQRRAPVAVV
jgi:hypothetical protein